VLGTHIFFFRDGDAFTVPAVGTAGRNAKPGATDPKWIDLGVIEDSEDQRESEDIKIFAPSPGRIRKYDVIESKDELKLSFTTKEASPLVLEVLYKTLPLDGASAQFNPLEGQTKKGWVKAQRYGQDDQQRLVLDVFVRLKITNAVKMGGALLEATFEAEVLHSTLNTGTL
jgi:hypothetical protein